MSHTVTVKTAQQLPYTQPATYSTMNAEITGPLCCSERDTNCCELRYNMLDNFLHVMINAEDTKEMVLPN